jgi:hypothetical protein
MGCTSADANVPVHVQAAAGHRDMLLVNSTLAMEVVGSFMLLRHQAAGE